MTKTIVFCADGTWNGPGYDLDDRPVPAQPSNVLKLFHWLAGQDTLESTGYAGEAERVEVDPTTGEPVQVAKYLDGVGYDQNWLVKLLGGAFGAGLITRIVRGYTFVSRSYRQGDRIVLVGFSRGAYTARALAGLILDNGLLDATQVGLTDKEAAYRLGGAVWTDHQKRIHGGMLPRIESLLADLPGFFTRMPDPGTFLKAPIQTVAVWDTVGAMGIPRYTGEDERIDTFRFANTVLSPNVQWGFQAFSLDEERVDFTPTLWNKRAQVTQVLFPGAHADVGGSYPVTGSESGLSDGALNWMQAQLATGLGADPVHFGTPPVGIAADPAGVAHQPWIYPPYNALEHGVRRFPDSQGLVPDGTVAARSAVAGGVKADPSRDPSPYVPGNLPVP
jgi:uncharacterized protein (DUF2235 family)